ncbi:TRAP transporter substrate-binding protein [Caenimonas sp. SL110]|uniref:TRAP transporter substrate-binding protein n=1 Tax=Caenimonas sp. SL110 TaxID=1450524 RepID=UPI000653551F|nr:TRAP transporter substrate-binding protein [Caenimonas sp. SL110]
MKRYLLTFAAAAAALMCAPASAQTVLTGSSWIHPTHALTVSLREWCGLVEKNSNGKVKCNILPRHVSTAPGTYDAVRNGLVDVSFTVHGYTPGRFLLTKMAEFPFLGDSSEPISVAFNRVAMKYPQFGTEHPGVKPLAYFTHGPGVVFNTKKPVAKMDDLLGLKWRVGGGVVNDISKAIGMNVTLKPAPESYELLSGGVMDGTLFPAESVEGFRLDKIIKHQTIFPGGLYNTSFVFMMNADKYNKLAPDEKKAVDDASGEVLARLIGRQWDKADRLSNALMQANNVATVKADAKFVADIKAKTSPLEQAWVKDAEAKGLKDAAKVLAEFRSEIAKASK